MLVFDWDAAHIARHGVTPEEVEEAIQSDPFDFGAYIRNGEERFNQVGETSAGRILTVVSTLRGEMLRVVTAHTADRETRAAYQQMKGARDATIHRHSRLQE